MACQLILLQNGQILELQSGGDVEFQSSTGGCGSDGGIDGSGDDGDLMFMFTDEEERQLQWQ